MLIREEMLDIVTAAEFWLLIHIKASKVTFPSNKALLESTGWHIEKLQNIKRSLIKKGVIIRKSVQDAKWVKDRICSKNFQGLGVGDKACAWCQINTCVLHSHHYPTPKSANGTETVDICPNCHAEYHFYFDNWLCLNPEFLNRYFA